MSSEDPHHRVRSATDVDLLSAAETVAAYMQAWGRTQELQQIPDIREQVAQLRENRATLTALFCRLQQLAESAAPEVWLTLGQGFLTGLGTEKNRDEAGRWFRRAADAGHTTAMVLLGHFLKNPDYAGDLVEAADWFRRAADLGDPAGMVNLGFAYREGQGVPCDLGEALRWFIRATEAGHTQALIHVGRMYARYLNSPEQAIAWFVRAAEAKVGDSEFELAMLYDDRKSPVHNSAEAVKWYRVLAAGPAVVRPRVMLALARHCRDGDGTPRAPDEAKEWLRRVLEVTRANSPFNREAAALLEQIEGDLL